MDKPANTRSDRLLKLLRNRLIESSFLRGLLKIAGD